MLTTSQCISIVMETKYYMDHLLQDALSMGGSTMVRLCLYVDLKHIHPKLLENSISLLQKVSGNNRTSVSVVQFKLYNEFTRLWINQFL